MIILTGAAGFIGSNFLEKLNREGVSDIIIADDFSVEKKKINYQDKVYTNEIHRSELMKYLMHIEKIDFVFHIGARTDTTEFDKSVFDELNLNYSKQLWLLCTEKKVPFIYASSAMVSAMVYQTVTSSLVLSAMSESTTTTSMVSFAVYL